MDAPLLNFPVNGKRDLLLARQRARQVAGLLGFPPQDQAAIAAAVFALACHAHRPGRPLTLQFRVGPDVLEVFSLETRRPGAKMRLLDRRGAPSPGKSLRLVKPLPVRETGMTGEDLAWALRELDRVTPRNLFEEVRKQNQELLRALHDLQVCQGLLSPATRGRNAAA